jgi:DNA-binding response OmpR family regulator
LAMQDIVQDDAQYGAVDVMLFDAVPSNRGTTRAALSMMGFKQIIASSDLDEVVQSISLRPFDVLIADISGAEPRVCKLVREIRQGDVGANPFMTVLLTSWGVREDYADAVMASGADDVLIRPYSVSFLALRVKTLVEARKAFVVTADYIGPCRRKGAEHVETAGLVKVPNSLRLKAKPEEAAQMGGDILAVVREAQAKVGQMRLASSALQMRLLAHFALEAVEGGRSIEKYKAPMTMFSRLLRDKLQGSADTTLARAAAANTDAVASAMQGQDARQQLTRCVGQSKILHERLNAGRSPADIELEFELAIGQLVAREQQDAPSKTGT